MRAWRDESNRPTVQRVEHSGLFRPLLPLPHEAALLRAVSVGYPGKDVHCSSPESSLGAIERLRIAEPDSAWLPRRSRGSVDAVSSDGSNPRHPPPTVVDSRAAAPLQVIDVTSTRTLERQRVDVLTMVGAHHGVAESGKRAQWVIAFSHAL